MIASGSRRRVPALRRAATGHCRSRLSGADFREPTVGCHTTGCDSAERAAVARWTSHGACCAPRCAAGIHRRRDFSDDSLTSSRPPASRLVSKNGDFQIGDATRAQSTRPSVRNVAKSGAVSFQLLNPRCRWVRHTRTRERKMRVAFLRFMLPVDDPHFPIFTVLKE